MKKLMISGAAIAALVAGQAVAATGYTQYGNAASTISSPTGSGSAQDNVSDWYIYGQASDYCVLGTTANDGSGNGGENVEISSNSSNIGGANGSNSGSETRSGATSDGIIHILALQSPSDHANAWNARINMSNSVCNTGFTIKAQSTNGGLNYTGSQTGNDQFAAKLGYTVGVTFGGVNSTKDASSLQGGNTSFGSSTPAAGTFQVAFTGAADNSKYLLSGVYKDSVLITMTPNASGT